MQAQKPCILMLLQRGWGKGVGHFLAKRFAAEGYRLAGVTFKKSAHEFHRSQREVRYEYLINNDVVLENPEAFLAGEDFTLEEITATLGIDSIWPLIFATRDIARSYRKGFYYSNRQELPDEQLLLYAKAVFKYMRELFREVAPDVVVAPVFTDLPHLMLYHFARMKGVPTVMVMDTKVSGVWTPVNDPYGKSGAFLDRIDALNAGAKSENAAKARKYLNEFREAYRQPDYMATFMARSGDKSFYKKTREFLAPFRRIAEYYFRPHTDRNRTVGPTIDWRPPSIILRDYFQSKQYARGEEKFPYYSPEKLGKFVYFPLQSQPEATIDVLAPLFYNQIEVARAVALSLPGDYTLVVKDHPSMYGLRSPAFLRDLAETPNVKLVHFRVPHEKLIKESSLVVSLSGTSLAEAGFYQRPAIQFGELGTTEKLPNVIKHSDFGTLAKTLKEHLNADVSSAAYERKIEQYVAAAFDTGYEVDYWGTWEGDPRGLELTWKMFKEGVEHALSKAR
jgi:hypothetical protein